jgi:voltage-gated potassium channel
LIYNFLIVAICLLYLFISTQINVNIVSGILICLCGFALTIFFKSYALFYANLLCLFIISFKYYAASKNRVSSVKLLKIFVLNLINISISVYGMLQVVYFHAAKFNIQKYIPLTEISIIELAPVVYIVFIYFVAIILVLSINNNLTVSFRCDINFTVIKTMTTIISVVLIIIFVNAILYFLVHNFPMNHLNSPFAGNFLKDAIRSNYKLHKAFIDCLWFSASTFFTVGYGDMHPVGNIMYLLSTMEMISAYILGMIMVPILLLKMSNK